MVKIRAFARVISEFAVIHNLQQQIIEYVDKVCETEDDKDYKKLCSQIDLFVAKLYNLSMDDYRLITTVLNE